MLFWNKNVCLVIYKTISLIKILLYIKKTTNRRLNILFCLNEYIYLLTIDWFLMSLEMGWSRTSWSEETGRGINGAPTIPRSIWIWASRPPNRVARLLLLSGGDRSKLDLTLRQAPVLLFSEQNNSSGMGISKTVSKPSSLSKLGQSVLMFPLLW